MYTPNLIITVVFVFKLRLHTYHTITLIIYILIFKMWKY
jgi:hypothetical protein